MSFPQEFPKSALTVVLNAFGENRQSSDVIALAAYELAGYGLGLYFGDPKYPMGLDLVDILKILQSPEFEKAKEAVLEFMALVASGTSRWRAFITIAIKYGPVAVDLIKKLVS